MNSQLRIQVTAEAKQALAQLKAVRKELDALRKAQGSMSSSSSGMAGATKEIEQATKKTSTLGRVLGGVTGGLASASQAMVKWGKNMQWAGRQLEFRITLPLLALGSFGFKWAKDFESSMVKVRKVYGDTAMSGAEVLKNTKLLERGFIALSNIYGVHAEEIADIGAFWAQAGAQSKTLLELTQSTVQAMVVGNLSLEESTKGLITIMDAYDLSVGQLTKSIALLNTVENETPANMQDLIEVIGIAGSTAKTSGVSIQELAALTSTLVPAFGTASQVGNSLKSTLFRIMAPTKQAADAFRDLGVNINDADWQSESFTGRLQILAQEYQNLGQQQKIQFARDVAQLRQGNRLIGMLDDLSSGNSRYLDTMKKTNDETVNAAVFARELSTALNSPAKQWEILTNRMRNMIMQVMLPLLPAINSVVGALVKLALKFEQLAPSTQKMIMFGAAFLALLGPVVAYIGTLATVIGFFGSTLAVAANAMLFFLGHGKYFAKMMVWMKAHPAILNAVKHAWQALGAAVSAAAYIFSASLAAMKGALFALAGAMRFAMFAAQYFLVTVAGPAIKGVGVAMAGAMRGAWVLVSQAAAAGASAVVYITSSIMSVMPKVIQVAGKAMAAAWRAVWAAMTAIAAAGSAAMSAVIALGLPAAIAAAVVAVGVLAYVFRDELGRAARWTLEFAKSFVRNMSEGIDRGVEAVRRGMYSLPMVFGNAFRAVISVIGQAIRVIRDLLSYLNPFATHSPSLVQNVQKGVRIIGKEFAKLTNVAGPLNRVATAVKNLGNAFAEAARKAEAADLAEKLRLAAIAGVDEATYRETLGAIAEIEGAIASIDGEISAHEGTIKEYENAIAGVESQVKAHENTIKGYEQELKVVEQAIKDQELALKGWQDQLDALDIVIERETDKLGEMQDALGALNDQLSVSQERIQELRNTPISGTYAFEDAIFANTQEQNQLRLQLALLEQQLQNSGFSVSDLRSAREELNQAQEAAVEVQNELVDSTGALVDANDALNGSFDASSASADEVRNRMALLAGEIESLRGEQLDLRLMGAGSDVLVGLEQQMGVIDSARRSLAVVLGTKTDSGTTTGDSNDAGGSSPAATYGIGGVTAGNIPTGLFGVLDQMDAVQRELDKKSVQGEILGLERGLALDPGNKAISDAFRTPEMGLGEILGGIAAERGNIVAIEAEIRAMEAAIAAQEGVIESLNAERDVLQASYDAEERQLEVLNDAYSAIQEKINGVEDAIAGLNDEMASYEDAIRGVEDAISTLETNKTALEDAKNEATTALDTAVGLGSDVEAAEEAAAAAAAGGGGGGGGGVGGVGGGGGFEVPGGLGGGLDTDDPFGLQQMIDDLEAQVEGMFDDIDLVQGVKDWWETQKGLLQAQWEAIVDWLIERWGWIALGLASFIVVGWWAILVAALLAVFGPGLWEWFKGTLDSGAGKLEAIWNSAWGWITNTAGTIWGYIEGALGPVFSWIGEKIIGPAVNWIKDNIWMPFWENVVLVAKREAEEIWLAIKPGVDKVIEIFNWLKDNAGTIFETVWNTVSEWMGKAVDFIKSVWDTVAPYLGPVLGVIWRTIEAWLTLLWLGMKAGWDLVWGVIEIAWETITTIIGGAIETVSDVIQGFITVFTGIWETFAGVLTGDWGRAWEGIKTIISGAFEIITGFINGFINGGLAVLNGAWELVKLAAETGWGLIEGVLQTGIDWIDDTFLAAFRAIPGGIGSALSTVGNAVAGGVSGIAGALAGGINAGIDVVNKLGDGINSIASWFGLGRPVPSIGHVWGSSGGVDAYGYGIGGYAGMQIPSSNVGPGFVTNQARAIVGEGSRWPEYVIPTDPRHRGRAHSLAESLLRQIGAPARGTSLRNSGAGGFPAYAQGGVLGGLQSGAPIFGGGGEELGLGGLIDRAVDAVKKKWKWVKEGAIDLIWTPIHNMIVGAINGASSNALTQIGAGGALWLLKKADEWVRGVRDAAPEYKATVSGAANLGASVGLGTSGGGGGSSSWGSSSTYIPSTSYGNGPHAAGGLLGLMNGGIVKGGRGGVAALIGEGRHDEAVIPLDGRTMGRTVNIYGDITLPDVTNVDEFLANLEAIGS